MKNIHITTILLFISLGSFAQYTLTFSNNGLVPGDSATYRSIRAVDPGTAGPNQIWDFSKIEFTGKDQGTSVKTASGLKTAGVENYNTLLHDGEYDYFMNATANTLEERGYLNNEKKISLVYTDPLVKMKFPFSYADQFTAPFAAVAYYSQDYKIDFTGSYSAAADAFGTLIMPDMVLKNTLRIKSVKSGLQTDRCGTTEVNIVKYSWYAPGFRYPVVSINTVETRRSGSAPEVNITASVNTQQNRDGQTTAGQGGSLPRVETADVSVILFPNPFRENLTYNYFLRKQLHVSIDLYDMSGKYSARLLKNQLQSEGLHSGELDGLTRGLAPGVYYIRFTFDKQVVINKIVKI